MLSDEGGREGVHRQESLTNEGAMTEQERAARAERMKELKANLLTSVQRLNESGEQIRVASEAFAQTCASFAHLQATRPDLFVRVTGQPKDA